MRYVPLVIYVPTFICAIIAGFFEMKTRREMEDVLDFGKVGPGMVGKALRNVVKEYKLLKPNGELTEKYNRYARLRLSLLLFLVVEVIFLTALD